MADEIAVVRIKADISGLKSGTADVVKELQKIDRQGKLTQDGMGKLDGATSRVKVSLKKMADETAGTKNALSGVEKATDTTKQTFKDLADSAAKTAGGMGKAAGGMSGLLQQFGQSSVVDTMATSMSNASDMVQGVSSMLSGLSSPGGAAALAVTAVAGIGTAMFKLRDDMIKADIAKHFGDIELSAEEVEEVAKRLTTTDWTIQLDTYTDAKEKLEEHEANIRSALEEMNRLDWKISVGMELTEEEKKSYQNAVERYTKECTAFIEQKGYTVSIALQATLGGGTLTRVSEFSNSFYTQSQKEMVGLGEKLAQEVNKEFEQKTFNFDSKAIQDIKQRMSDLKNKVAQEDLQATVDGLQIAFGGIDISDFSQKSIDQVNDQVNKNMEELENAIKDARHTTLLQINSEYQMNLENGMSPSVAQKIKDDAIRNMELTMSSSKAEVRMQGVHFAFGALESAFESDVGGFTTLVDRSMQQASVNWEKSFGLGFSSLKEGLYNAASAVTPALRKKANNLCKAMEPQEKALTQLAKKYTDAGQKPPQSIIDGLSQINQTKALAGRVDGIFAVMAEQIANSPEAFRSLQEAQQKGYAVPQEIVKAIEMQTGMVYTGVDGVWKEVSAATEKNAEPIKQYLNKSGLDCGNEMAMGLAQSYGLIYDASKGEWVTVSQAALASKEDVKNVLSQYGIETTDELINKIMDQKEPARRAAVALLLQLKSAALDTQDDVKQFLQQYGINVTDSMITAIMGRQGEARTQTIAFLCQMQGALQSKETEDIKAVFQQYGMDVSNELINSLLAQNEPLRMQALVLLSQLQGATDEKRWEILDQLYNLGIDVTKSMGTGLFDNSDFVYNETKKMVQVLKKGTDEEIGVITPGFALKLQQMGITGFQALDSEILKKAISSPEINQPSQQAYNEWVANAAKHLNNAMEKHGVIPVIRGFKYKSQSNGKKTPQDFLDEMNPFKYRENGGYVDKEELTWIAEGNKPEMVIPLSPEKRSRGIGLWEQAGATLGMLPAEGNSYPVQRMYSGNLDYDRLTDRVVEALRQTPIEVRPEITVQEGGVYLDTELAGRQLAPVISCKLAKSLY